MEGILPKKTSKNLLNRQKFVMGKGSKKNLKLSDICKYN